MSHIESHNGKLKQLYNSIGDTNTTKNIKVMVDLDSIDNVLRETLSIEEMKQAGSFFTGQKLSSLAIDSFHAPITDQSTVFDPTCGAGNLLIECSRKLSVKKTLTQTLSIWGSALRGYDTNESFVYAAKLRLILEALNRGVEKNCSLPTALSYFKFILVQDVMDTHPNELKGTTHAIMNPPYSMWQPPKNKYWKLGKINAAAIVSDHILNMLPSNCQVSCIFPDVLRSGTRYGSWRTYVSSRLSNSRCIIYGRFSSKAHVDVFILNGIVSEKSGTEITWYASTESTHNINDFFNVCIGPVVEHRSPKKGDNQPYLHAKNAIAWETISDFDEFRLFQGKLIPPPFVVVRRTSSPSLKFRAIGTIIGGKRPVAVENHLIVIQPKSSKLSDCTKLISSLKKTETNKYINDRIRCRHLTVGVIKDLPLEF